MMATAEDQTAHPSSSVASATGFDHGTKRCTEVKVSGIRNDGGVGSCVS